MTGLLALVRMPLAPQSARTFFLTSTTAGRRALLQSDRMAQLLVAPGLKFGAGGESSKEAVSAACICDHAPSLPSAADTRSGNPAGKGTAIHQRRFLLSRET